MYLYIYKFNFIIRIYIYIYIYLYIYIFITRSNDLILTKEYFIIKNILMLLTYNIVNLSEY